MMFFQLLHRYIVQLAKYASVIPWLVNQSLMFE